MSATTVITPKFRVSYPNVFRARKNDLNGKDEFSVVALFPKGADLTVLKQAAAAAAKEKWGDKVPAGLRSPFRDQAEREKDGVLPDGLEAGAIFINMKSTQRPGLVNASNQPIIDETEFYAGCFARAQVAAYAYDQKGNKGISFGIRNLQKLEEGESLSGRQRAEDAFEPVAPVGGSGGDATSIF